MLFFLDFVSEEASSGAPKEGLETAQQLCCEDDERICS